MRTTLYVAGSSTERITIVRPYMARLIEAGFGITHDWTTSEGYDRRYSDAERLECAHLDLLGVSCADIVWCLLSDKPSEGQAIELGYALALHKPIVLSGACVGRSIFHGTVPLRFEQHESAFNYITRNSAAFIGIPSDYLGGRPGGASVG